MSDLMGPLVVLVDRDGACLGRTDAHADRRLDDDDLRLLHVAAGGPALRRGDQRRLRDARAALTADLAVRDLAGTADCPPGDPSRDGVFDAANEKAAPGTEVVLVTPFSLRVTAGGYEYLDHDGGVVVNLDPAELSAALELTTHATVAQAAQAVADRLGRRAPTSSEFEDLVDRLAAIGLVQAADGTEGNAAFGRATREMRHNLRRNQQRKATVGAALEAQAAANAGVVTADGRPRTRVVPVNDEGVPLSSIGLLWAYASVFEDGRLNESYEFIPDWANLTVPALTGDEPPAVYLFSNYLWSHAFNMEASQTVKATSPGSLTIHGGPNTPKYDGDVETYFRDNPHVDIAVHGEGEATFAAILAAFEGRLDGEAPDLDLLRDVPGLSYRSGDGVVRNGARERIADLDTIPSPFAMGIFDSVGDEIGLTLSTIETNRGCPYGCSFCDWGSATMSRIRKFDLQRVYDDLEWCARHKSTVVFCGDANFGIFAHDVDIARKVVELKQQYGYPKVFESSYAKNTTKHLSEIIKILSDGGILSTGTLSLQSVDPDTLATISRKNIKVEKYDDLASEFDSQKLPLIIELMMGLPGSTLDSFMGDLQQCVDREVRARVNPTEVLVNSPMNNPEYREEHRVEVANPVSNAWQVGEQYARNKALVISTATFTRDEYQEMERRRRLFLLYENFGVLRQLSRFVRQETGLTEMAFYAQMAAHVRTERHRWPGIGFTLDAIVEYMIPPASWRLFIDDLHRYLTDELGLADDSALATALQVQHGMLPARGRVFPARLELAHDFAAWHKAVLTAKLENNIVDWGDEVPRLAEFGPAHLEVTDPGQVSTMGLGMPLTYDADSEWELHAPVGRPMRFRQLVNS